TQVLVALLSTRGNNVFVDLQLDWRVLGFTATLAVLTCILFGLAPAFRSTRTPPGEVLKSGGRGNTAGRERFRIQKILVAVQVALSLTLVAGAMLFVRSLRNLVTLDAGFQQEGVLITNLSLQPLNLSRERASSMNLEILDRLRALPGVIAVGATDVIPLSGSSSGNRVWMDGSTPDKGTGMLRMRVGPDYFKTLRTPLLAGREFNAHDNAAGARVAIVNQSFARTLTNAENPVGRRFWVEATPSSPQTAYEIVGMVRDSKYQTLREDDQPIMYLCLPQESAGNTSVSITGRILIRSALDLDRVAASVRTVLQEIHPEIRFRFQVFQAQIRDSLLRERLVATLSGFFGALAALLAAAGLYGVISYAAARRTNEIGVRMALGASRGSVFGMIIGDAAKLTAIGIAIGVGLAIAGAKAVQSLLYGLRPSDPVTLLVAVVALAAVAFAASYFPARRAARLDPMVALREE
ncbi:MAG TPA: FtsX-like permease family protein, partial [Bryobacteraceae bacterium]|nr:FtsX-like permease family protein [Bryobacteraceae bacterium]